jgi:hypothetical protein
MHRQEGRRGEAGQPALQREGLDAAGLEGGELAGEGLRAEVVGMARRVAGKPHRASVTWACRR